MTSILLKNINCNGILSDIYIEGSRIKRIMPAGSAGHEGECRIASGVKSWTARVRLPCRDSSTCIHMPQCPSCAEQKKTSYFLTGFRKSGKWKRALTKNSYTGGRKSPALETESRPARPRSMTNTGTPLPPDALPPKWASGP